MKTIVNSSRVGESEAPFVGLITHEASRYRGLQCFSQLEDTLRQLAFPHCVVIHQENGARPPAFQLAYVILRPLVVVWALWRVRLNRKSSRLSTVCDLIRELYSEMRRGFGSQARAWILRNQNITHAHEQLWRSGLRSGRDWIGVFEDDLCLRDEHLNIWFSAFSDWHSRSFLGSVPTALFLSQSFPLDAVGIKEELTQKIELEEKLLITSEIANWTDSLAATIYSHDFVEGVLAFTQSTRPFVRAVLPVDWLVDLFLLSQEPGRCRTVHVRPGLLIQQSLSKEASTKTEPDV